MFCPHCGKKLSNSSKFCSSCGEPMVKNQTTEPQSAYHSSGRELAVSEKGKKYLIVVKGQRNVNVSTPLEPHEYYIRAADEENAQEQALEFYRDANPDAEILSVTRKLQMNAAAIISLSIACLLSFIPWYSGTTIWSMRPSMLSLLVAIGLYSAVIIRVKGLQNSFNSFSQTVLSLLTTLFCASFINLFIGDVTFTLFTILGFSAKTTISGNFILLLAVLFSWLGVPAVAGLVWIVLFILAITRITSINSAMGIWGIIYIFSAFLGIIFQLKQQSGDFLRSMGSEMMSIAAKTHRKIFKDIGSFKDSAKNAARSINERRANMPQKANNTRDSANSTKKKNKNKGE